MALFGKKPKSITTRSGRVLKVNRSLGQRWLDLREAKSRRKVDRLRGLPKSRIKRTLWRLRPKYLAEYWFSRDGAITALKISGIAIVTVFIVMLGIFAYFRKDLPNITDISGSNLGGSISYYDRTGKILLWQDYSSVKRVPVASSDISNYLKQATVSVEDRNFYNEKGFDIKGITRAVIVDALHHGGRQGGSTITQQLVKLTQDFNQNRNLAIKVKELILAVELERSYTKDEILTGYLNVAPYGGLDYGAQAAAGDYFHKNAKDLTLPEAAFLAAIPKSPAYYSPYSPDFDQKLFLARYDYVLDSMEQTGKITKAQVAAAKKVDILAEVQPQSTKYAGIRAPYFVLAAKSQLQSQFIPSDGNGSAKVGGWKVITTLDMNMQQVSEQKVQANLPNVRRYGGDEEATVTEDVPTGQIVALVGGSDFDNPDYGKINFAQWPVSPGSSIKPYDYSALIQNTNAGAGSVLYDVVAPIPGYPCTDRQLPPKGNCLWDFDRKSPGAMSLRYALGGSRNIPAVKATLSVVPGDTQASINKVDALANAMMAGNVGYHCYKDGVDVTNASVSDQMDCTPSSGIGDGGYLHLDQHLNGLSTLGRMGQAIPTTYILKIYNSSSSKPFYTWTQPKPTQVMDPQTAYIMNNMLSDPQASYLGGSFKFHHYKGWNIAVKTGTTNSNYDGLMMAWSTKYSVGTWVGYHTRTQAITTSMENLTEPVTKPIIEAALDTAGTPVNWQQPTGIQTLPAYNSAMAYSTQGPAVTTDIFPSWYKPKAGTSSSTTIDRISNKVATSCTPDLAKQTVGGSKSINQYSIDLFYPPGGSANSSANTSSTDDVHSCDDQKPSVSLTVTDTGGAGTVNTTCTHTCTLTATATQGTHPLYEAQYGGQGGGYINFLINGQVVNKVNFTDSSSTTQSYTYTVSTSGTVNASAQVIDTVLYTGSSDSISLNVVATNNANNPANVTTAVSRYTVVKRHTSSGRH